MPDFYRIPERTIIFIGSLVLAYLAIWFGDAFFGRFLSVDCGLFAIGTGRWFFYEGDEALQMSFAAAATLVLGALAFGGLAEPITTFGFMPFRWLTPWLLILVLISIPSVIEFLRILDERPFWKAQQRKRQARRLNAVSIDDTARNFPGC